MSPVSNSTSVEGLKNMGNNLPRNFLKENMKKFDVVIVNFNGEKIITKCLKSLYDSTFLPRKVIIYDNNSDDQSVEVIKKHFPQIILIEGKKNIGFGRANNEALKRCSSEFVLLMNNDILLDKYCARGLLEGFREQELVIINPIIYKGWDKKSKILYAFGAELNIGGFNYGLYDNNNDRNNLNSFSAACCMVKTNFIKKHMFEKKFFMYYEEPDISIRILQQGYKIGRRKKAICYHLENYSSPKKQADGITFRQFYGIQNRWYLLGKYWPFWWLFRAMPINLAHLFYNVLFFIKNGKIKEIKIIGLAFIKLFEGRRHYKRGNTNWIRRLSKINLTKVYGLQKRVYR